MTVKYFEEKDIGIDWAAYFEDHPDELKKAKEYDNGYDYVYENITEYSDFFDKYTEEDYEALSKCNEDDDLCSEIGIDLENWLSII